MSNVSSFGMAIIAAIVALSILAAASAILLYTNGNPQGAGIILGFLAPTITGLFALVRVEQTSAKVTTAQDAVSNQHKQTINTLVDIQNELAKKPNDSRPV